MVCCYYFPCATGFYAYGFMTFTPISWAYNVHIKL